MTTTEDATVPGIETGPRAGAISPDGSGPPTPPACITADRVGKRFDKVVALEDATFTVPEGGFASVLGPSGCGKSTLLRLVSGLTSHTGDLRVRGERITTSREDVGMMFQRPTLLPWKTAIENVLLPCQLKGRIRDEDRDKGMDLLALVGLQGFEFSYPRHLSGGMQQRVSLARLLMTGADVLLLDEPFGALDEFTRERLNLELLRIHEEVGATTMFVTHNISEAVFLADEVLVMTPRPGRLASVVEVPFEHPREIELMRSPEFTELVFNVREILGADH
jgi:NitT/TauT family transport system ATP-binding protein